MINIEKGRIRNSEAINSWKKWGPYVSDRQWGTVREDYSKDGSAWEYFPHDMARSRAYRWSEDGIAGICDDQQHICFALAFWNYKDPIIKERFFGLTGNEGNHGEDVKEYFYYQDSTPTHSYMRMMYRYPHDEFPYNQLVTENKSRGRADDEFDLIDSGIFDNNKFFDIYIEYAKNDKEDILVRIEIANKYHEDKELVVLPTVWFRNTWDWDHGSTKPSLYSITDNEIRLAHHDFGTYNLYLDQHPELLFCENETNTKHVFGQDNGKSYFKDGINNYIVDGEKIAVNPANVGTKAAGAYRINVAANNNYIIRLRLSKEKINAPFENFDNLVVQRKSEADIFYSDLQAHIREDDLKNIQRQAYAGMMWAKQYYNFDVSKWLDGDEINPPFIDFDINRKHGRNSTWRHMHCSEIISMPDKWEYPWFAAWDLAFHCIPIARIDPSFAKDQLQLLLD
ncbi:MAG TPA: hypothetical protein VK796_08945, partial [Cytophaga sp.]|nr:hypothetical protein [Cytophaga sp.]